MQTDMHYYGTYAMARAAGLAPGVCRKIAAFAQFVDDNAEDQTIETAEGAIVHLVASAHHTQQLANLDKANQRYVWVPFHFLPGGDGDAYTERLKCRKNSALAQQMVEHHLALAQKPYAIALMGVAAHVYADTFSHYGFSGVSSRRNRVVQEEIQLHELTEDIYAYITGKAREFWEINGAQGGLFANFRTQLQLASEQAQASVAEALSGALGHGPVHTYPDRPYLRWEYRYEHSREPVSRNNYSDFVEACHALHRMFFRFAEARPDLRADGGVDSARLDEAVRDVLQLQADKEGRIARWQQASRRGDLYAAGAEAIPPYDEDEWLAQRDLFGEVDEAGDILEIPVFRFYQAAALHRSYVLRDLLPQHGLLVN